MALALVGVFLFTDWPRDVAALAGAGVLLLSQRFHSSKVMGLIDWELLILFMGLFVVNRALERPGWTRQAVASRRRADLADPATLVATLGLSNLVSNVPAVMVPMPLANTGSGDHVGVTLALVSTMAGNLLIVGSIANLSRGGCRRALRHHDRLAPPRAHRRAGDARDAGGGGGPAGAALRRAGSRLVGHLLGLQSPSTTPSRRGSAPPRQTVRPSCVPRAIACRPLVMSLLAHLVAAGLQRLDDRGGEAAFSSTTARRWCSVGQVDGGLRVEPPLQQP